MLKINSIDEDFNQDTLLGNYASESIHMAGWGKVNVFCWTDERGPSKFVVKNEFTKSAL